MNKMKVDINKFADWWMEMHYGVAQEELDVWGELDSGNDSLNEAMAELESAMRKVNSIMSTIESTYSEEIKKLIEEKKH